MHEYGQHHGQHHHPSHEATQFAASWAEMATRVDDVPGPLSWPAATAGAEPTRGLQHAITSAITKQLEQASTPHCKARGAFLEIDENSSARSILLTMAMKKVVIPAVSRMDEVRVLVDLI